LIVKNNQSNQKDNAALSLYGITIDLTNLIFDYFGAVLDIKRENQWVTFNGSRVTGGTLGEVILKKIFFLSSKSPFSLSFNLKNLSVYLYRYNLENNLK